MEFLPNVLHQSNALKFLNECTFWGEFELSFSQMEPMVSDRILYVTAKHSPKLTDSTSLAGKLTAMFDLRCTLRSVPCSWSLCHLTRVM